MRFVTLEDANGTLPGMVLDRRWIADLGKRRLEGVVSGAGHRQNQADDPTAPLGSIKRRQPIPGPRETLGIGLNHAGHAAERLCFRETDGSGVQRSFDRHATAAKGPDHPMIGNRT